MILDNVRKLNKKRLETRILYVETNRFKFDILSSVLSSLEGAIVPGVIAGSLVSLISQEPIHFIQSMGIMGTIYCLKDNLEKRKLLKMKDEDEEEYSEYCLGEYGIDIYKLK